MGLDASPHGRQSGQSSPQPQDHWDSRALYLRIEEQGDTLRLNLSGEFDWACVGRVEAALDRISPGTKKVVFDLQYLSFLDSGGLRTILRAHERSRLESFELVVVRPHGLANRVFTLTRAGGELKVIDP